MKKDLQTPSNNHHELDGHRFSIKTWGFLLFQQRKPLTYPLFNLRATKKHEHEDQIFSHLTCCTWWEWRKQMNCAIHHGYLAAWNICTKMSSRFSPASDIPWLRNPWALRPKIGRSINILFYDSWYLSPLPPKHWQWEGPALVGRQGASERTGERYFYLDQGKVL